jgi:hypothetical protein
MEVATYTSAAACQAAVPQALQRNSDLDYPVVGAECRAQGQFFAAADKQPPRTPRG